MEKEGARPSDPWARQALGWLCLAPSTNAGLAVIRQPVLSPSGLRRTWRGVVQMCITWTDHSLYLILYFAESLCFTQSLRPPWKLSYWFVILWVSSPSLPTESSALKFQLLPLWTILHLHFIPFLSCWGLLKSTCNICVLCVYQYVGYVLIFVTVLGDASCMWRNRFRGITQPVRDLQLVSVGAITWTHCTWIFPRTSQSRECVNSRSSESVLGVARVGRRWAASAAAFHHLESKEVGLGIWSLCPLLVTVLGGSLGLPAVPFWGPGPFLLTGVLQWVRCFCLVQI